MNDCRSVDTTRCRAALPPLCARARASTAGHRPGPRPGGSDSARPGPPAGGGSPAAASGSGSDSESDEEVPESGGTGKNF